MTSKIKMDSRPCIPGAFFCDTSYSLSIFMQNKWAVQVINQNSAR